MLQLLCAGLARLSSEQGDRTLAAGRAAREHSDPQVSVYCSWSTETAAAEDHALDAPSCSLTEGEFGDGATVISVYNRSTNATTGFATLDIVALEHTDPRLAAFAAGYAEGYQTAPEIELFYENVYEFGDQGPSEELTEWVTGNDAWTREQAEKHAETDDYWMSVATVLSRFDGMHAGYERYHMAYHRLPSLSKLDLLWINLDGDLYDLQNAVGELATANATSHACKPTVARPSRTGSSKSQPQCAESWGGMRPIGRNGRARRGFSRAEVENSTAGPMLRCSALVKHRADKRELYFGHATWDTYATAAPRIYKHLTLPRQLKEVPNPITPTLTRTRTRTLTRTVTLTRPRLLRQVTALRTISMSSSPGFLSSVDDWFLIGGPNLTTSDGQDASATLSVIETSLEIEDVQAYTAIRSDSVLSLTLTLTLTLTRTLILSLSLTLTLSLSLTLTLTRCSAGSGRWWPTSWRWTRPAGRTPSPSRPPARTTTSGWYSTCTRRSRPSRARASCWTTPSG